MLFKHRNLPLNLAANASTNFIPRELKYFQKDADRIFCLSMGPFFQKDLLIINEATGLPLVNNQDYTLTQLYTAATKAAGKSVYCAIRVTNPQVSAVSVEYRAVGGEYQSMVPVISEMKEQFDSSFVPSIPYSNIGNIPNEFPSAEHTHAYSEINNLDRVFNALYLVLTAIYTKQREQYHDIKSFAVSQLEIRFIDITDRITTLREKIQTFEQNHQIGEGDFYITDNDEVPSNYLKYGTFEKVKDCFILGADVDDTIGDIVGLSSGSDPATDVTGVVTNFWKRIDDQNLTAYQLSANKTSVNEGGEITFTVNGGSSRAALGVGYIITGVQEADLSPAKLTGTLILNSSGNATLTVNVLADQLTDGVEHLRFTLRGYPDRFVQVAINDTSTSSYYESYFASDAEGESTLNVSREGDVVYYIVKSHNTGNDFTRHLVYDGSTTSPMDFDSTLPSTLRIRDRFASLRIQIANDKSTEATEYLNISLSNDATVENSLVSSRLRILDRSKSPTYEIYATSDSAGELQINQVSEGQTFYIKIKTSSIDDGTQMNLAYTGTYNASDFSAPLPNIITIVNDRASVAVQVIEDLKSEGVELLNMHLLENGSSIASYPIRIADTSVNDDIHITISSNQYGTNSLNWLNEGDVAYVVIFADGYPDGTILDLVYTGTASQSDFYTTLPPSVIIQSGYATFPFNVKTDRVTEGEQFIAIGVREDGQSVDVATYKCTINDTSLTPDYAITFSSDQGGLVPISEANEGDVIYVQVNSTYTSAYQTMGIDVWIGANRATVANGDVEVNPPSTVQLLNGRGVFDIRTLADNITETDETVKVSLRQTESVNSAIVKEATLLLRDTSMDPTWTLKISPNPDGTGDISGTTALEGQTVYLVFSTVNVEIGTTFWLDYFIANMSIVDEDDFNDGLPETIEVTGDDTIVPYQIRQDYTFEANQNGNKERFLVNIYTNAIRTQKILTTWVDILEPTFSVRYSGLASGVGNITLVNEGDVAYIVVETENVPDGSEWELSYYINGELITESQTDILEPITHTVQVFSNQAIVPIAISSDNIADGEKLLQVHLRGVNQAEYDGPLAQATIRMIDTSFGGSTADGVYNPGQLGTLVIPANSAKRITLVAGGGAGDLKSIGDPSTATLNGYDGESSWIKFGSTTIMICGSGGGGKVNDLDNSGIGGLNYINTAFIDAAPQFDIVNIIDHSGLRSPEDAIFGANSVVVGGQGAGSVGNVFGTGGGSASALVFDLHNSTSSALTLSVYIAFGGLALRDTSGTDWNNGCLIVESGV